ncbi:hypothetical protein EDB82DRAFT_508888, partial [Fusarium venenatum]|uniref:uncharacterized protein n=1 Tax=Fusarium venenatum TaxID=56646 RepID=UPI001D354F01
MRHSFSSFINSTISRSLLLLLCVLAFPVAALGYKCPKWAVAGAGALKTPLCSSQQVTIHHHQVFVLFSGECTRIVPSRSILSRTDYHLKTYLRPPKLLVRACSSLVHWRIFVAISALSPSKPSIPRGPMGSPGSFGPHELP